MDGGGPGNSLPVITHFEASPASSSAPAELSLRWQVQDADGDPLICLLGWIGPPGPGSTVTPCPAEGSTAVTLAVPGSYLAHLAVLDGRGGAAEATSAVEVQPAPALDLSIARIDWGQTVVSETLRLVAGKDAMLRVHVVASVPNVDAAPVRVTGTLDGGTLGPIVLQGPGVVPTSIDAGSLEHSYRATLPRAWISPGLELHVEVDPEGALTEADEQNNQQTVVPEIGAGTALYLTEVPVVHGGVSPTLSSIYRGQLLRIWPLKDVSTERRAPYTFSGTLTATGAQAWGDLLQQLNSVRVSDGSSRYYLGLVTVTYAGGIGGVGYVGRPTAVARDDSIDTAVHELGHNFGREHAPCGTTASGPYPYPNARLGSFGYDVPFDQLIAPDAAYDLMSYCSPTWVSDFNYQGAQDFLEASPPQASARADGGQERPLLLVSGRLTADGAILLNPLQRLTGTEPTASEGPWSLRLHTAAGIRAYPFATERVAEPRQEHFTLVLPDPGELTALEIFYAGQWRFSQLASPFIEEPARPRLRELDGRLELQWDERAWPAASVAHLGTTRTTLGLWLRGGRAVLPLDGLEDGGRFEVGLSDGLRSRRWAMPR